MTQYCHCGPKANADEFVKVPAPAEWTFGAQFALKCNLCEKISHAYQEDEPDMFGPKNARTVLNSTGRRSGIWETTWALRDNSRVVTIEYYPYPRRAKMTDQGRDLLMKMWTLLDAKCAVIMTADPLDNDLKKGEREEARHAARGVAECIALLMSDYYENADKVVREAVKRYKTFAAGDEPDTPGLAEHLWDSSRRFEGVPNTSPRSNSAAKKSSPAKRSGGVKSTLTSAEAEKIKVALKSNMFKPAQLAQVYKCSEDEIKALMS